MVNNQAQLFLIFIIDGIIIGILFDFFRIIRKSFYTKDIVTYIEDFLFWILTGFIILYSVFTFNNGEIRLYMFLATILGIILYLILFSTHIIKTNVFIIKYIKKIIKSLTNSLKIPVNHIYREIRKIFFKPISFVLINIRKGSTNFYKNKLKIVNKMKNKEGF